MYEAINARDWDTGFEMLADGFEWHEPAQAFHGGTHRGFDEIRTRLETQIEVFDNRTCLNPAPASGRRRRAPPR